MTYEEALQELDARLSRWLDEYPHTPDHAMIVEWWKKQAGQALSLASELTRQYITDRLAAKDAPKILEALADLFEHVTDINAGRVWIPNVELHEALAKAEILLRDAGERKAHVSEIGKLSNDEIRELLSGPIPEKIFAQGFPVSVPQPACPVCKGVTRNGTCRAWSLTDETESTFSGFLGCNTQGCNGNFAERLEAQANEYQRLRNVIRGAQ